eukprot:GHVQ01028174.1.p1 GENE.GHVQ01028174.1~~GHVQ01028174.1.p1  ORF type:complete len:645 (+),score=120.30 GHVQ01028174.1:313-2247(+)
MSPPPSRHPAKHRNSSSSLRYAGDGYGSVDYFINSQGLYICTYTWPSSLYRDFPALSKSEASCGDGVVEEGVEDSGGRIAVPPIVVLVHGVQNHARFEFLGHSQEPRGDAGVQYMYDGSWVQTLNRQGFDCVGIDLQGHGLSDGWKGSRCNVDRFDDFSRDVVELVNLIKLRAQAAAIRHTITTFHKQNALAPEQPFNNISYSQHTLPPPPIFLLGVSMGGCVCVRAVQLLAQAAAVKLCQTASPSTTSIGIGSEGGRDEGSRGERTAAKEVLTERLEKGNEVHEDWTGEKDRCRVNEDCVEVDEEARRSVVRGCVLLSPMLSVEKLKNKNKLALTLAPVIKKLLGHVRLVPIKTNTRYPHIEEMKRSDQICSYGPLPARIALECVDGTAMAMPSSTPSTSSLIPYVPASFSSPTSSHHSNSSSSASTAVSESSSSSRRREDNNSQANKGEISDSKSESKTRRKVGEGGGGIMWNPDVSLLICHSRQDTMCELYGSEQFHQRVDAERKRLCVLDDMWHYLTLEPGNFVVRDTVVEWLAKDCYQYYNRRHTNYLTRNRYATYKIHKNNNNSNLRNHTNKNKSKHMSNNSTKDICKNYSDRGNKSWKVGLSQVVKERNEETVEEGCRKDSRTVDLTPRAQIFFSKL